MNRFGQGFLGPSMEEGDRSGGELARDFLFSRPADGGGHSRQRGGVMSWARPTYGSSRTRTATSSASRGGGPPESMGQIEHDGADGDPSDRRSQSVRSSTVVRTATPLSPARPPPLSSSPVAPQHHPLLNKFCSGPVRGRRWRIRSGRGATAARRLPHYAGVWISIQGRHQDNLLRSQTYYYWVTVG
jgi:hypothetical protein